jgi:RNA polymerase sigma-32 factor
MEFNIASYETQDIQSYINFIKQAEYLTLEEEQGLAKKVRETQDTDAAKRLVLSHLRVVLAISYKYNGYGLQIADLIQEGTIGLMKAVKKFDERVGVRLVTFASYWIKAEIIQFILNNWRLVKVATTAAQKKLFFKLRTYKNVCGRLSNQDIENISKDLNVTKDDIRDVNGYLSYSDTSIYSDNDEDSFENHMLLADDSSSPEILLENKMLDFVSTEGIQMALSQLDERKRYIISNRWLNDNKETLEEISRKFKISVERVRQLEQEAIAQMRKLMNREFL